MQPVDWPDCDLPPSPPSQQGTSLHDRASPPASASSSVPLGPRSTPAPAASASGSQTSHGAAGTQEHGSSSLHTGSSHLSSQPYDTSDLTETTRHLTLSSLPIPRRTSMSQVPIASSQIIPTPITAHSHHTHSPNVSVNVNVLSPPTPAPSPSPRKWRSLEEELIQRSSPSDLLSQFQMLDKTSRFAFLAGLVGELQLNEALVVSRRIEPRLKRDFLRELPAELALHCLSFVDDAKTLARASAVSRYWYDLLQDERTWKEMCERQRFRVSTSSARAAPMASVGSPSSGSNNSRKKQGRVEFPKPVNQRARTKAGKRPAKIGSIGGDVAAASAARGTKRAASFKQQFKTAYQTEANWRTGGRLLSTHMSQEDGVVTTVAMDDEYLVIGMANAKIHVFDSATGIYRRSLIGHAQGVWALVLVTTKSGTEQDDLLDVPVGGERRRSEDGRPFGVPPFGSSYDGATNPGPSRYRDDGQSRRASFTAPQPDLVPPVSSGTIPTAASFLASPTSERREAFSHPSFTTNEDDFVGCDNAVNTSWGGFSTNGSSGSLPVPDNVWRTATTLASMEPQFGVHNMPPFALGARPASVPGVGSGLGLGVGTRPSFAPVERRQRAIDDLFKGGKRYKPSDTCGATRGFKQSFPLVVSGGCDREVRVWNVETSECLFTLSGHTSTIRCLKVVSGRPIAITGSRDFTLRTWDIYQGRPLKVLSGHEESVRCVEIAGELAVSGSYDSTCRVWHYETGECLHVLRGHYAQIYAVAFDGVRVVSGSLDSTVRVWSAETGDCLALLQGHTSLVGQLQLYGDRLVTAGSDGRVIIFDLSTFRTVHRLCAHDNSVTSLQFDNRFVVSGGNDGRVKLWDVVSGQFVRELTRECEAVWRVVFRDDRCAILCQRQGKIVLEVLGFMPDDSDAW